MKKPASKGTGRLPGELRQRAEALLRRGASALDELSPMEARALLNELQVHQIELQLQNEELQRTQQELSHARDRYADLYEFAPIAYLGLDEQGLVGHANLAAAQLLGVECNQLVGSRFDRYVAPSAQDVYYHHRQALGRAPGKQSCELQLQRSDGQYLHVAVCSERLQYEDGAQTRLALIDVSARHQAEEALRELNSTLEQRIRSSTASLVDAQAQMRSLLKRMVERQEQESRTIARELHDSFGQDLAAVNFRLSSLSQRDDTPPAVAESLRALHAEIQRIAGQLHDVSRQIHPRIIEDLGLEAAIRRECEVFSEWQGRAIDYLAEGTPAELPPEQALSLFRILQEALRNVARHAGDARVRVYFGMVQGMVVLRIEDSGKGFDAAVVRRKGGLGLISMEERVRFVGGTLRVESIPGDGTVIEARVPLP